MPWLGVILGLCAAFAQSLGYIFSRRFIVTQHSSTNRLLVLSHAMMGLGALAALPALWDPVVLQLEEYGLWLLGAAGFYLLGQAGLFVTLRKTDASRIAPLLGLKVVAVALIWGGLLGEPITPTQWAAVGLAVLAAFVLNYTGGRLPRAVTVAVPLICLAFACSDVHIVELIAVLREPTGPVQGPILGACLSYVVCGLVSVALLPWFGSRRGGDWLYAAPYAAAWSTAIALLFGCLSVAGPVLANIALSTRGLWSIALGAMLAQIGMEHLERKVSGGVLLRRCAAAAMMVAAIALYQAPKAEAEPGPDAGAVQPPVSEQAPPQPAAVDPRDE